MVIHSSTFIHPTSIIDEGAEIGKHCKIWHWTHICKGAVIGDHCSFGQNVFIGNKVKIGNNVKVQNNVSIFDEVYIEDHVFCGPSMVFTNVYNPRSEIIRKEKYRPTVVKRGASLGANCTIICGITINKYAFVAAGSLVRNDLKPFELVAGVPAKQIGWMSAFGERMPLPKVGRDEWICTSTGDKYYLIDERIKREINDKNN